MTKIVLYLGSFNPSGPQNYTKHQALITAGYRIDDLIAKGNLIARTWRLVRAGLAMDFDYIFVGFPGWGDVLAGWVVAKIKRRPLIYDLQISAHDTLVLDNKKMAGVKGKLLYVYEWLTLRLPDRLILEAECAISHIQSKFGLARERFINLPLSCKYDKLDIEHKPGKDKFVVSYHGYFIPLHGVDTIIGAAGLLKENNNILFELAGDGQDFKVASEQSQGLANVELHGYLSDEDLKSQLSRANVILGHFGSTVKSPISTTHKLFEAMAIGIPLIIGRYPATEEILGKDYPYFVNPGDPESLADMIVKLNLAYEQALFNSVKLKAEFMEKYSYARLGRTLERELEKIK